MQNWHNVCLLYLRVLIKDKMSICVLEKQLFLQKAPETTQIALPEFTKALQW